MWKGFKVIDADAHMHEPEYLWERYVEAKYRDRVHEPYKESLIVSVKR
jgi:hypothetical protein